MEDIIEVDGSLLSENHLVRTPSGWVFAHELVIGSEIINFEGRVVKVIKVSKMKKKI